MNISLPQTFGNAHVEFWFWVGLIVLCIILGLLVRYVWCSPDKCQKFEEKERQDLFN